jgi:DNA-binding transcriptional ArsR family regulator
MIDVSILDHPPVDAPQEAAEFLRLMADSTRRRIFLGLMAGEVCNCEMVNRLGLAQNLISHHLRQLRRAGLVRTRRDDRDQRWVYYSVDPNALVRVHSELTALFHPSRLGERVPDCGPVADTCD